MRDVFVKELLEMFRDKRVRSTAFLGPALLIFGVLFLISTVVGTVSKPQSVKVHVVEGAPEAWIERFKAEKYQVQTVTSVEAGKKMIGLGEARAVVAFDPPKDGIQQARVMYDESEQLGQLGRERVLQVFRKANELKTAAFFKANSVPSSAVTEVVATPVNVGVAKGKGAGEFLVGFLPYLIVIWAFYGGMSSASDLVAGEKERSTLETLLISPLSRAQIVLGKIFALAVICLLSSLASLVGLAAFVAIKPPGSDRLLSDGLGISLETVGLAFALLVPLVLVMASILILLSSYAKNAREAQTYLGLGSFVVIMPAMFSQFIGLTDYARAQWVHFVPVLNVANQLRQALQGKPEWGGALLTIGVNLAIALVAGFVAVQMFQKEEIISKG